MSKAKVIALAVAILVLLVIVLRNSQSVTVSLLFVNSTMPLAFLLAVMLTGGFASGLLAAVLLRPSRTRTPSK